ncbi:methyl-accepting chemotaxis protein [Cohnella pontilimi]|uniref:Methyl-accepting chemotaxis protein n=1 Tax=Cohnella pontilimi TaxID=2564100 RepID=A0A4U0FCK1_9BACL|nr:methyl-accepting chemotaxis protein [Cohnella pontilimi]TJY42603.1 methyl-accepting chemotaxis protein [Cohnella pontilimi]
MKMLAIRSIRTKLIVLCLIMLLIPTVITGLVGYEKAKSALDDSGKVQLKNDVRYVIAMIGALDEQVKSGAIKLDDAQERVKQIILGEKNSEGKRPITDRFDLGENGYMFIYDVKGNTVAHPNLEGQQRWDAVSPDGILITQELIKNAQKGGDYIKYENALASDPNKTALKISYSELDPNWGWVVGAGTYMSDFNKGANSIFNTLLVTLVSALIIGGFVTFVYSGQLSKPMQVIAAHMKRIADGDLREKLHIRSKDEVGQLAASVNDMIDRLQQLIGGILRTSQNVAASSQQISASTQEIASGTVNQSHASQSILDLFKELSTAINSVTQSAVEAAELSNSTAKTALEGGEVVSQSIEGMNQVNEQMTRLEMDSKRIGEIIEVIDDIAEQTNLLALNAAIEAARAGEQGRGFAVVADEVRKLAERSGEATKQITTIIKGMQNNMKESVESVAEGADKSKETGKAFEKILTMVNDSAQRVTEIAAASEEQSAQADGVMRSVESISSISEQAAAAAEQTASASQSLAHSAEELNHSVSVFKIE